MIELNDKNFDELVMSPNAGRWFVKIYAPGAHSNCFNDSWCGHCQKLAPIWDDIAETLDQEVNVADVGYKR